MNRLVHKKLFWIFSFLVVFLFLAVRQIFIYFDHYEYNCFHLGMPLWLNLVVCSILIIIFSFIAIDFALLSYVNALGYLLIISGSVFNLLEKILTGCVLDYFNIVAITTFPKFNLPDVAISIGVLTLSIGICISK